MVWEPLPQIADEFLEEVEVGDPVRVVQEEVRSLSQRASRTQLGAALVPEPLGFGASAEPVQRGVERCDIHPERRGGLAADAAGGSQGVEELISLPDPERAGHPVLREEPVQVRAVDHAPVGAAPASPERRDNQGALAAVTADEPFEDGALLVEQQLVQEREGPGRGLRWQLAISRAPDQERNAGALRSLGGVGLSGGRLGGGLRAGP